MTDRKSVVRRSESAVSRAWLISRDSLGMDLGELRQVVAAAEGMPDKSTVIVEKLTKSVRDGCYWVREITIEHEAASRD